MEGWVDLGDRLHTEMVYLRADGHPYKYGTNLAQCTAGSLVTFRSWVRRPNLNTSKPPCSKAQILGFLSIFIQILIEILWVLL